MRASTVLSPICGVWMTPASPMSGLLQAALRQRHPPQRRPDARPKRIGDDLFVYDAAMRRMMSRAPVSSGGFAQH